MAEDMVITEYRPWRDLFRVHPAAAAVPAASAGEFAALKADIAHSGLRVPVEFLVQADSLDPASWALMDGRTRLDALHELGFRFAFGARGPLMQSGSGKAVRLNYNMEFESKLSGTALERVISLNVLRRHLNREQKAQMTGLLLAETPENSDREIARIMGISPTTVGTIRARLEALGELLHQDVTLGADSKWRTTERKTPKRKSGRAARPDEPASGKKRTEREELSRAADRNAQVQERLEDTIGDIEQLTGRSRNFDLSPGLVDESAENFIALYTMPAAARFVRALQQRLPQAGAPAAAPTGEALPPALYRRLLDAYHTLKPGTQEALTVPPEGPYPYWLLLLAAVGYDNAIEVAKCGLMETEMADPAVRDEHFGEVLKIVVDYWDDDDLLKDRIDEIRAEWDEDEAEDELTDDEAEALAKIGEQHAAGTMWVGPKWRKANGISEELVTGLVNMGKLMRGAHNSVQRVDDGSADEEETEAEEETVEQRENASRIVDLARLNPEWTPLGLARKLHLDEHTVRAALRDAGIRPEHQGKGWGGTSRTSIAAMMRRAKLR
jgi:hypothetical protein